MEIIGFFVFGKEAKLLIVLGESVFDAAFHSFND